MNSNFTRPEIKLLIWLGGGTVVGGVIGSLSSPGDYPWALKVIFALWLVVLFFYKTTCNKQKISTREVKIMGCFAGAVVVGGTVGFLSSPGDYPWALKIIFALWLFIGLLFELLTKYQGAKKDDNPHEAEEEFGDLLEGEELKNLRFARVWSNGPDAKEDFITEEEFQELISDTSQYDFFLINRSEFETGIVGESYFLGKPVFPQAFRQTGIEKKGIEKKEDKEKVWLTPLEYRLLFHTLQNDGIAGDVFGLIERCWKKPAEANRLRDLQEKQDINPELSTYRKGISGLSKFLQINFNIQLSSSGTGIFRLSSTVKFCVIQLE